MATKKIALNVGSPAAENPAVGAVLAKAKQWREEVQALRRIVLGCALTESLKWGQACYSLDDRNIVLIHGFKEYCALLFFKGVLMKDPKGLLIQQTEQVQAGRQIRFTGLKEIVAQEKTLKAYIQEAIAVEKAGLKVPMKETKDFPVAEEFKKKLETMPALKKAFGALTPGRQRAYLLHFSAPKLAKTREDRVEKCLPGILAGKGLLD
jgi:uncharacterized protein YdeI (YjbR/CyaY-like superfamily)